MPIETSRETMRDLVMFVTVARELSFTRAAAHLGLSQTAVSYTIKALEERLGVRLLTRTTRSVSLTEAGERLLETTGAHLDGIDTALAGLSTLRDKPAGMVRIAASDHAADTILRPVLERILPHYPDVSAEIVIDNAMTDIAAERCDAGIRLGEHLADGMVAAKVGPDIRMAVVATPEYFSRRGHPTVPGDLTDHSCLALRLQTHGGIYSWEFEKDDQIVNIRPTGQIVSNLPAQIVSYCLSGMGVACMPESYFVEFLANGRLERVLDEWCAPFGGYHIYYPSRRQQTQAFSLILSEMRKASAATHE
ncbi:LysR family transcriptional regulator [Agrobacterium sp. Ap1]|uniref:LysR family transcriptional regulator n=1 Tax=Agrobacterium sp. Ap1 TaxID=2815337 RepID=UPI001A8EB1FB|nr:LysR family transcriptional regulator [Agrobacterium sp. Ap1]MBO0144633.1 LysR family transcriptional regulator [Agrobacterium sp. Ap1]